LAHSEDAGPELLEQQGTGQDIQSVTLPTEGNPQLFYRLNLAGSSNLKGSFNGRLAVLLLAQK
jgi:hypothetical protein